MVESDSNCHVGFLNMFILTQPNKVRFSMLALKVGAMFDILTRIYEFVIEMR
jgi:hypothetical protein